MLYQASGSTCNPFEYAMVFWDCLVIVSLSFFLSLTRTRKGQKGEEEEEEERRGGDGHGGVVQFDHYLGADVIPPLSLSLFLLHRAFPRFTPSSPFRPARRLALAISNFTQKFSHPLAHFPDPLPSFPLSPPPSLFSFSGDPFGVSAKL